MPIINIYLPIADNSLGLKIIDLKSIDVLNPKRLTNETNLAWFVILRYTYCIISLSMLASFLYKLSKILNLKTSGQSEKHLNYNLIRVQSHSQVFSFFKNIYIPHKGTISDEIISHEKVHVKQLHSIDVLLSELMVIVFWFNPITYFLKRAIAINHEFIADHQTSSSRNPQNYIHILTKYHLENLGFSLASHFSKPSVVQRITMLNRQNTKTLKIKFILPILTFGILFSLFCCESQVISVSENSLKETKTASEKIYDKVDIMPRPAHGFPAYYKWVAENITYPEVAQKEGIEGKVFVQFIIDKTGDFTNVKVLKGVSTEIDEEALRVIKMSKPWTAGEVSNRKVNTKIILPITFTFS